MPEPGRAARRVLVTGASGFIGRHLLQALLGRGDHPVALVRDPSATAEWGDAVDVVHGDVTDAAAVDAAVRDCEAVVHLAAETRSSDPKRARQVNVEGTRLVLDAARRAGVRRVVALSTVAVHRPRLGPYATTKREMERVVLESGLEAVILRPSLVYGSGDRGVFHRMRAVVSSLPVVPVIGRGKQRMQPIHVDDLVKTILFCLDDPTVVGRSYDLVGPDDLSVDELLTRIEQAVGGRKRHVHIPMPAAMALAKSLGLVMKDPPLNADNVIGADTPTPVDPEPARRDLPAATITLSQGLSTIHDPIPSPARHGPPVRVVIVGLGRMGITHAALLNVIPGAHVAGAVEIDRKLAMAVRGMGFTFPVFGSLDEALDAARPHAVVVATPNHTHADLAVQAAERGVSLLVEKPLGHTLESAQAIADAARANGVIASCGYVLAYLPTFERAKELLDQGVLGKVRRFESTMLLSQVFGPKRGWLYDPSRAGGGVIPNLTSHLLFLLHWYLGRAESVKATTRSLHTEVDDETEAWMRFDQGVEGTVKSSWSVEGYPQSVTVIRIEGENGTLVVDNRSIELVLTEPVAGLPEGTTRTRTADLRATGVFHLVRDGFSQEDEDFVRAVRGGPEVRTSIGPSLHVQAVIDAIYRSAGEGRALVEVAGGSPSRAAGRPS